MAETNIVAIIEARMSSSRLHGKHLLEAAGKPMQQHLVEKLKKVPLINEIIIATPRNKADDALIDLADRLGVSHYRGSEENVMQRVLEAGEKHFADIICEVTGDCSIIDPSLDVSQLSRRLLLKNLSERNLS